MTFAYDKTGNLTAQNVGEGQSIQNSYNEIGQVTTVKNNEGTIEYQYNRQGYLVSVTNVNGDVVSYAYDEYGNKTSMTYPDGRAVRYTYDSMNRMTSVTGLDGEVTTYAYDAAGRRVETSSRTLTTEYRYDVVGSLVEQSTTGSSNIRFQYTYNLNGYITGEVRTENGAVVESLYTYGGQTIFFSCNAATSAPDKSSFAADWSYRTGHTSLGVADISQEYNPDIERGQTSYTRINYGLDMYRDERMRQGFSLFGSLFLPKSGTDRENSQNTFWIESVPGEDPHLYFFNDLESYLFSENIE